MLLFQDPGVTVSREGDYVKKIVHTGKFNFFLGRFLSPEELIGREKQALERLQGVPGVQRIASSEVAVGENEILTYFVEGVPLKTIGERTSHRKNAVEILREINNRGIIKILGSSQDIIVNDGGVVFIDFGNVIFDQETAMAKYSALVFQEIKMKLLFS